MIREIDPEPAWLVRYRHEELRRQQFRARMRRWFVDNKNWWLGIPIGFIGGLLLTWLLRLGF
jgi:hypothetical protein